MGFKTSGSSDLIKRNLLGPILRKLRKERGVSAEEVAARIELSNVGFDFQISANHLHKVERQEKPLTDYLILAYSEALGISAIDFFQLFEESLLERTRKD